MYTRIDIKNKLNTAFSPHQSAVLADVVTGAYDTLVKSWDFNELKGVVKDLAVAQQRMAKRMEELAVAQQRTEKRVEELAVAQQRTEKRMEELAVAQQRTEKRMEELAVAQQRTEKQVKDLAVAQQRTEKRVEELTVAQQRMAKWMEELAVRVDLVTKQVSELTKVQQETSRQIQALTQQIRETNQMLGGLSMSVSYSLENEAYRLIPALLEREYGIKLHERFIRTYIHSTEINLFGRGTRDGHEVLIIGETKLRLDERRQRNQRVSAFKQLKDQVDIVRLEYPDVEIIPLLLTHHARPGVLKSAQEQGIIVIQSFEW